jgi:hypothetical protein
MKLRLGQVRRRTPGGALGALAALVGVGLATVGLEKLLDRLLGWPEHRGKRPARDGARGNDDPGRGEAV